MGLYVVLRLPRPSAIQVNEPETELATPYLCFMTSVDHPTKITPEKSIAILTAAKLRDLYGSSFDYKVCQLQVIE